MVSVSLPWARFPLPAALTDHLYAQLLGILRNLDLIDSVRRDFRQAGTMRDMILENLRAAISIGFGMRDTRRIRTNPTHQGLVNKALEYWASEEPYDYSVAELCGAIDANERTVRRAFREFYGTSPYQFILRKRLSAARSSLSKPAFGSTVTDIAFQYGFSSASDFT